MKTIAILSLFLFLGGCNYHSGPYKDIYWDENKDGQTVHSDKVNSDDDLPVFDDNDEPQPNKIDIIEE